MGELRLHLAMTAIEPNKLFTTFVVSRKFPKFALEKSGDISRVCCRLFAVFWAKICVKAAKIWFNRVYGSHDGDLCLPRRSTEGHPSLSAHPWERTFAPSAMYIQREFDAYLCHFAFLTHIFAQVADL